MCDRSETSEDSGKTGIGRSLVRSRAADGLLNGDEAQGAIKLLLFRCRCLLLPGVVEVIVERPALERRVTAVLEAGRIPVVLGGCGTGRSSLLLRLAASRAGAQYLDMAAAATTPERCLDAVLAVSRFATGTAPDGLSARAAFDALLDHVDAARAPDGGPATFLLDDFIDIRTFESFPGLRQVQRDFVARLAASPSHFVLASRFTTRVHRLL